MFCTLGFFQNKINSPSKTESSSPPKSNSILSPVGLKKPQPPAHLVVQDGVRSDLLKAIRDGKLIFKVNTWVWKKKRKRRFGLRRSNVYFWLLSLSWLPKLLELLSYHRFVPLILYFWRLWRWVIKLYGWNSTLNFSKKVCQSRVIKFSAIKLKFLKTMCDM